MLAAAAAQPGISLAGLVALAVGCFCLLLLASAVITTVLLVRRSRRRTPTRPIG
jgi:hypothetical protein